MKVSQLIEQLQKLPQDADLSMDGPDIGGYDVVHCVQGAIWAKSDGGFHLGGFEAIPYRYEERREAELGPLFVAWLGKTEPEEAEQEEAEQ